MTPYRLHEFDVLPSTNAYALEHLNSLAEGAVVWARVQTAGRGRLRRRWLSDVPGNLCLSLVLKPSWRSEPLLPLASLTQFLSLVLCQTLDIDGVAATIKWPNDVQVGGKKIAGILAEFRFPQASTPAVVLGLGVNLNLAAAFLDRIDQPATALNLLLRRPVDSQAFLHRLLDAFFAGYQSFLDQGFSSVRNAYLQRCTFLGQELTVHQPNGILQGIAIAVNAQGALEVRANDGTSHTVLAGDLAVPGD